MAYGTTTDAQTYWTAQGYSGAPTDALLSVASVFVDSLGWRMTSAGTMVSRYPGQPASASQVNAWPRSGATDIYGNAIAGNVVPGAVERATYEAAYYELQNPGALNAAIRSDERVVQEKVGPLSVTYAEPKGEIGMDIIRPIIPAVMTLLAPVLTGGSNPYGITGVVA